MTAIVRSEATGSVAFYDGDSLLGIRQLLNGRATLIAERLSEGNHNLRADYLGGPSNSKPYLVTPRSNVRLPRPSQSSTAAAYLVSTITGGLPVPTAANATLVDIPAPTAITIDAAGNIFFAALDHIVYRRDSAGGLTRYAGTGTAGFYGDGGPAVKAQLNYPTGVAADLLGNLYIADDLNFRIRKVDTDGNITTIAGTGANAFFGDGGPATAAALSQVTRIALDGAGNLYVADQGNSRIRKISTGGIITTVAGTGGYSSGGDLGPATSAQIGIPWDVAVDASGNLYIAEIYQNQGSIRKVSGGGIIDTMRTTPYMTGFGLSADSAGNLYVADPSADTVTKYAANLSATRVAGNGTLGFTGDGGLGPNAALNNPTAVTADGAGNVYIVDKGNLRIREVSSGHISTVAGGGTGDGGPGALANTHPYGVAGDSNGNLYIADFIHHRVRHISPDGIISTVGGTGTSGFSGDGGPAISAQLDTPTSMARDAAGNLYILDSRNQRVRKIFPNGNITTAAGTGTPGYSGDNGPATNANLFNAGGLAADSAGNLYIADSGNARIRKVDTKGTITTFAGTGVTGSSGDEGPATAATLERPQSIAVDPQGNVYIGDFYDCRVRKVTTDGTIHEFAGISSSGSIDCGFGGDSGPATTAHITPVALAVDSSGNVFISDFETVRMVNGAGIISIIAGNGQPGYSGDGGPALDATFNVPNGLFASNGKVYVADTDNGAVRVLTPAGGPPVLTVLIEHAIDFTPGLPGAYTIAVANAPSAGTTTGTITVTDLAYSSLTPNSMTGVGWTCTATSCTTDQVIGGGQYSFQINAIMTPISVTPPQDTNMVTVTGGGAAETAAEDVTYMVPPLLGGPLTANGVFYAGQQGTYTLLVTNGFPAGPASGPLIVIPSPPPGLTVVSMSPEPDSFLWNCAPDASYCIFNGIITPNQTLPPLTITVNVAQHVPSSLSNEVILHAGGILPGRSPIILGPTTIVTACDFSAEGNTTPADVQAVINQALGQASPTHDLNQDGTVNVLDVMLEMSAALGQTCWAM